MAGPIALSSALSHLVSIKCPWCGQKKLVAREPAAHRVCRRCHRHFPDPLTKKKRR